MLTNYPINIDLCSKIDIKLIRALELIYEPNGLIMSKLKQDQESKEYSACKFKLNSLNIAYRSAHTTPTKIGQFVTLWKRIEAGPIQPYDLSDAIDFFVVSVATPEHFGQFVFPKQVLFEKDIVSKDGKGGKRAIRVYPPWNTTESSQAKKTQKWQLNYFLLIPDQQPIDTEQVKKLYTL